MSELISISWSDQEKATLVNDGAVSIVQREKQFAVKDKQVDHCGGKKTDYIIDGRNRLVDFPSKVLEVAIYPDPEKFFVQGTFNKSKGRQEAIIARDAHQLRNRLGISNLDEILPEAPEVMEILFQHLEGFFSGFTQKSC
ncbi:hypothetical protein HYT74_00765 [Candidatus Daviesbacteria bacterium]|nr:hypothetical protein [Candidatus Daviesbacteria bacterium]